MQACPISVPVLVRNGPHAQVVRYQHYFQFSDFFMLYVTMQRSFVVGWCNLKPVPKPPACRARN